MVEGKKNIYFRNFVVFVRLASRIYLIFKKNNCKRNERQSVNIG